MNNNKSYAIIPNVAFGFGAKYHLNKDEFIMFTHLQFMKQIGLENITVTMVDMLVKGLRWETSTKSRDKKRVVDALEGLERKGYIKLDFCGKILNNVLTITINKKLEKEQVTSHVKWKDNPFTFKGFTRIDFNEYNLIENNGYYLIVFAYTKWRENAEFTYKIANKEWIEVLDVTDKTARAILSRCASFITKISGDYYRDERGQIKQETNTYTIKTVADKAMEIKEAQREGKQESFLDKEYKRVTDLKVLSNDDIFKQIFDKNTFIRFEGYKVWKETECNVVQQAGKKKIETMYKSPNKIAGEVADRLEREYQEYLLRETQQRKWLEEKMEQHIESIGDFEEFTSSYIKKNKKSNGFTDFFDDY